MMARILPQLLLGLAAAALPAESLLVGPCACGPVGPRAESSRPVHACCRAKAAPCCSGRIGCCRMGMAAHARGECGLRCNCRGNAPQASPATSGSQGQVTLDLGLIGSVTPALPSPAASCGIQVAPRATSVERCSILCRFLI